MSSLSQRLLGRKILIAMACASLLTGYSATAGATEINEITLNSNQAIADGTVVNATTGNSIESDGRNYAVAGASGVDATLTIGDGTGTATLNNSTGTSRRYGIAQNFADSTITIKGNVDINIAEGSEGVRAVAVRNNYGKIIIDGNVSGNINALKQYATVYDVWYAGASTTVNGNTDVTATANGKSPSTSPGSTVSVAMQVSNDGKGGTPTLTLGGTSTKITAINANYTMQLGYGRGGVYNFNSTDETILKAQSTYGSTGFSDYGGTTHNFGSKKTVIETVITDGVGKAHNVGFNFTGTNTVLNASSTLDGSEFTINVYGNGAYDPDSGVYGTYGICSDYNSDVNISTQKFNIHVESGHAVDGKMTFDSSQVDSEKYSDVYGIYALNGTKIDALATTDTNIYVKDFYASGKDACGILVAGSDTAVNLPGNVTIDTLASGTEATAYAVYATNGGSVTLGGTDKTVAITGDVIAENSGIINLTNATITGDISVSGEGSSISITGQAPTVSGDTKTYYATVNGNITPESGGTVNLTNAEVTGYVDFRSTTGITLNAKNSNFSGLGERLYQNCGTITLTDVDFISDGTQSGCHAISTVGSTINFKGSSVFSGNDSTAATNAYPGVISIENSGNVVIEGDGEGDTVVFKNNKGVKGGAVRTNAQYADGGLFKVSNVESLTFEGNQAIQGGGAISSEPSGGALSKKVIDLSATTITFKNNSATGDNAPGGAINNQNTSMDLIADTILFSGNIDNNTGIETEKGGGAIFQRAAADSTVNIGKTGGTVTFSGNKSNTIGGAIGVRATGGATSTITISGTTAFTGNTSKLSGGALWNKVEGTGTTSIITFNDAVTFSGNKAGVNLDGNAVSDYKAQGGAVWNGAGGTIVFKGGSTFSDNTAAGVANDIYNEGTLDFYGVNTLSGGVISTGTTATINATDVTLNGNLVNQDGGTVNFTGTTTTGTIVNGSYKETRSSDNEAYGSTTLTKKVTLNGDVELNHAVTADAAGDDFTFGKADGTSKVNITGNVSTIADTSITINGNSEDKATVTGTVTNSGTANLSNVNITGSLTNSGTATLENVNTTEGWTLAEGSVTNTNSLTNGTDLTAMAKVGTVNGTVYASSGTLDLRGVDLRVKGAPVLYGGTATNPTTLDTLKATRVFFGDIYDGGAPQVITNIILENCTTAYRAALGVYYDTLTVDTVKVNAAEGWYWTQQYSPYNYQMYTGFGGTLNINKSLTTGEYMNAGYSVGGTGITNLAAGAVLNCLDFQNTGNMTSSGPVSDEVARQNIAAGKVNVNGAEATLNAAALNNHAITTLGTVNLTVHNVHSTPDGGLFSVNYGTDAVLTIGQLNFLGSKEDAGDKGQNLMRLGDNATTTIGGLTSSEIGANFYATGTSVTTINKDGGNAVKYTGDIVFTTYSGSTSDNAQFSLKLDSADDYFTGAIRGTTSESARWGKWGSPINGDEVASTTNIQGMTLSITNGAKWNITGDSFVNKLTMAESSILTTVGALATVTLIGANTNEVKDSMIAANLVISSDATANLTEADVKGKVTNDNVLNLSGGSLTGTVTSSGANGKLNIVGDTTLASMVSKQDITVDAGKTLTVNSATEYLDTTDNVTLNGKLNMSDDAGTINKIAVNNFTANTGSLLSFDAVIGAAKVVPSDSIAVSGTARGTVTIDTANITVSGDTSDVYEPKVIHLFTGSNLSDLIIDTNGKAVATSEGYKYDFKQDTTNKGDLVTTKSYAGTLADIVQNKTIADYEMGKIVTYSLVKDYTSNEDLGTLTRVTGETTRELTIYGNGFTIDGGSHAGITVNSDDSLTLNNIEMENFAGDVVTNAGTLNIVEVNVDGTLTTLKHQFLRRYNLAKIEVFA